MLLLIALVLQPSCEIPRREARLQIEGKKDWYIQSEKLDKFLLEQYQEDGEFKLEYPPEQFSRNVYVSIDVTKSGFDSLIRFDGKEISWNEYNVRKFCDYLVDRKILQPGDRIKLQIFGSYPNQTENPKIIRKIPQDESFDINVPKTTIIFKSRILTSKYNDLLLDVTEVQKQDNYEHEAKKKILDWSIDKIKNPHYNKSYLFNHVSSVIQAANPSGSNVFFFITDGHIDFENNYFSPANFSPNLVTKIKHRIDELKLRPFFGGQNEYDNLSVVFHGLNSNGNLDFKNSQEEFLKWFLEGIKKDELSLLPLGGN